VSSIELRVFSEIARESLIRLIPYCDEFSQADAVAGDGDLGLNVHRAVTALLKPETPEAVSSNTTGISNVQDFRNWFLLVGDTINESAPSSFMTLVSKGLKKIGRQLPESDNLDTAILIQAVAVGVEYIGKVADAKVGDKTLMDALVPAVACLQQDATSVPEKALAVTLSDAAAKARKGADSTASMPSKKGRARWNPEKTIGHVDAGALVIARLFEVLRDIAGANTNRG